MKTTRKKYLAPAIDTIHLHVEDMLLNASIRTTSENVDESDQVREERQWFSNENYVNWD